MKARGAKVAWIVTVTFTLASTLLGFGLEGVFDTVLYGLVPLLLATSGLLVVSRQPKHRIGLLFCVLGLNLAVAELAQAYGFRAAETGWPAGEIGEWVTTWSWIGDGTMWLLVFVLFPNGHLPNRRWRFVPWLGIAGGALALPTYALSASQDVAFTSGRNPFFVDSPLIPTLFGVGITLSLIAFVGAVVSLAIRLRRARGVERQQLKWFAYAAAAFGVVAPVTVLLWNRSDLVGIPIALALLGLPTAASIAMLRYRLYDIDLVINRTMVYVALTAALGAAYLATVLLLQLALSPITQGSGLAVAVSTLTVAALFRPLRTTIQTAVDRRFYRRRYDAARMLNEFSLRLRNELDLEALVVDLQAAVRETVQPTHVSVWLRSSP